MSVRLDAARQFSDVRILDRSALRSNPLLRDDAKFHHYVERATALRQFPVYLWAAGTEHRLRAWCCRSPWIGASAAPSPLLGRGRIDWGLFVVTVREPKENFVRTPPYSKFQASLFFRRIDGKVRARLKWQRRCAASPGRRMPTSSRRSTDGVNHDSSNNSRQQQTPVEGSTNQFDTIRS